MKDLNSITVTGRLGREIELKQTQTGKTVGSTSLAVSSGYGENEKTIWLNLTFWEKTAQTAAELLRKGTRIFVAGALDMDTWTDQATGQQRQALKVVVKDWGFCEPKSSDQGQASQGHGYGYQPQPYAQPGQPYPGQQPAARQSPGQAFQGAKVAPPAQYAQPAQQSPSGSQYPEYDHQGDLPF